MHAPIVYPWHHSAGTQGFDQEDEGHDGEDVVVGGERCQPVDRQVADPDNEDRDVYRQDPDH